MFSTFDIYIYTHTHIYIIYIYTKKHCSSEGAHQCAHRMRGMEHDTSADLNVSLHVAAVFGERFCNASPDGCLLELKSLCDSATASRWRQHCCRCSAAKDSCNCDGVKVLVFQ